MLVIATLVYRPLYLIELTIVSSLLEQITRNTRFIDRIIQLYGLFFTIRKDYITLVY
jgi:hypothetical protein